MPALWSPVKVCGIVSELSKNMACMVWIWVVCVPQKRYRITTARWNSSGLLVGRVDSPPQSATTASSQSSSFDGSEEDTNTNINANGIDENLLPPALRGRTGPSKPPNRWILYRAAKSAELRADNHP
ncbi:hypothetical protein MCOR02_000385 [Pyricularia oryzae]|nr:hypothetical protein MCOR02_000385 [Pyricularia oryzae]